MRGPRRQRSRGPWLARRLARWALPDSVREPILGDLDERFAEHVTSSTLRAHTWYWRHALSLLLHYRGRRTGGVAAGARSLAQDLRWAWRATRRSAGSSVFVICTLALGLGVLLATLSAARGVILPADVFRAQQRTVAIWPERAFSLGELDSLRRESTVFEILGGFTRRTMTLDAVEGPVTANGALVSPALMASLRAEPVLGGQLAEEHERPGAERVALIGEGLWRRAFGADPGIVGRRVPVDGLQHTVLGVLPESTSFPGPGVELVLPLEMDPTNPDFWPRRDLTVVGRVRPGVSPRHAQQDVVAATGALARRFPDFYEPNHGTEASVRAVDELLFAGRHDRALLVLAAVTAVFLAICANLAGLMLSRNLPRGPEFATRAALGAGKRRIARQLLAEHLILGAVGGGMAALLCRPLGSTLTGALPEMGAAGPPPPALLAAGLLLAMTAAVALGAPSVLDLRRRRMRDELAGHAAIAGAGTGRAQRLLVALQIGLACALIAGTAMLGRTIAELRAVEPGIEPAGIMAVRLEAPRTVGATELGDALAGALTSLQDVPGVRQVGMVATTPWEQEAPSRPVNRADGPVDVARAPVAREQVVSPGTLALLGVELLAGRHLAPTDERAGPPVLLVNRTLARTLWPDESPERALGRRIAVDPHGWNRWIRIVGVVEDTRPHSLTSPPPAQFFLPRAQAPRRTATLMVRGEMGPGAAPALVGTVRAAVPAVTVAWTRPLDELLRREWAAAASAARLFAVLGVTALALCTLGVYAIVAATVRRRRRELALRKALGATSGSVARLVLETTTLLTVAGLAVGAIVTAVLGRSLQATLYGVSSLDPASLGLAALAAVTTVAAAGVVPTLWAMRLPPAEALRTTE